MNFVEILQMMQSLYVCIIINISKNAEFSSKNLFFTQEKQQSHQRLCSHKR